MSISLVKDLAGEHRSLNSYHISENFNNYTGYEAARTAFFVFSINKGEFANLLRPDQEVVPGDSAGELLNEDDSRDYLSLNVTKCIVPHFGLETGEYRRGNDVVKFATVPTWEGDSLEVDDVVGLDTKSILLAWQYLAYNPNTRMGGRMKDYKKKAKLIEYTQDYTPIRTWELEGVFITKLSEAEFDRENDGKRKISVTFSYDRAVLSKDSYEETLRGALDDQLVHKVKP